MKQTLTRTCFIALWLIGLPAYAAEEPKTPAVVSPGNLRVKAIEVLGVPDGDQLTLTLTPGPAATKAIRVYSEPSHTLLAIVIDDRFATTREGKAWLDLYAAEKPAALITTQLPDGIAKVSVPARPPKDERVAIYVHGRWPDGTEKERLIADGTVGQGRFAFTTHALPGEDPQHCCNNANCVNNCTDCTGPRFTCCQMVNCCWIKCGTVIGGCSSVPSGCVP
jgi:hypothetical protein